MARYTETMSPGRKKRSDVMKLFMTSLNLRPTDADEFEAVKVRIRHLAASDFAPGLGASQQSERRWTTFKEHVLDQIPLFVDAPPVAFECLYQYVSKVLASRKHAFKQGQKTQRSITRLDTDKAQNTPHGRDLSIPRVYRPPRTRSETQHAEPPRAVSYERSPSSEGEPELDLLDGTLPDTPTNIIYATRLGSGQAAGSRSTQPPSRSSSVVAIAHTVTAGRASVEDDGLDSGPSAHRMQVDRDQITDDEGTGSASRSPCRSSMTVVAPSCHTSVQPKDVPSDAVVQVQGNHDVHYPECYSEKHTVEGTRAVRTFLTDAAVPHLIPLFLSLGVVSTRGLDALTNYDCMRRTCFFGPMITYLDGLLLNDAFEDRKNRRRQAQSIATSEQIGSDNIVNDAEKTDEVHGDDEPDPYVP